MRKKRGVIKLWMAILLVFAGFIGVAGITTLTLYLTGRFNEEIVPPQDINFEQALGEGSLGFYDAEAQTYKVSSNFSLTITSSTENVTQNKVTLSLNGEKKPDADGYISNGVIKVPQTVQLDRPFEVVLEKDTQGFVQGGLAKITAKSQNTSITYPTVQIVVDAPVEGINACVHVDENSEPNFEEVYEVVVDAEFTIDTYFTPENGAYLFANSLESKKIFYSTVSSYIEYDWAKGRFVAKEKSGSDTAEVTVYTFANSYYQKTFMDEFERNYPNATEKQLAERAVTYFTNNPSVCVSKTIKIKVVDIIDVGVKVEFNKLNKLNLTADKKFMLTANSDSGDATLEVSILDKNDTPLNALFANVGILIPKGENLNIVGGKVMKVVAHDDTFDVVCEEYSSTTNYAGAPEGTEYYVLANTTPKEYKNYYWQLSSSTELSSTTLKLNFFFQGDENKWENLFKFEGETSQDKTEEPYTTATVTLRDEEPLGWKTEGQIAMEIKYDENGKTIPYDVNLNDLLDSSKSENVYTTVRYFLFVDGNIDVDVYDAFNCSTNPERYDTNYKNDSLEPTVGKTMPEGGYALYELDGTILTAVQTYVNNQDSNGKVYVVAGVVKTNAEGQIVKDGDKYVFISLNRAQEIVVNNTLSIANMTPTFTIDSSIEADDDGKYYIPAINVDAGGTQKTMLTFTLALNKKTYSDGDKLISAYVGKKLKVVCMDGLNASEHLKLEGLALNNTLSTNETLVFEGLISINETIFNSERPYDGKGLKLKLVYYDGTETFSKNIYNSTAAAGNETVADEMIYVYYQRVGELIMPNMTYTDEDADGVIDNYVSVSNESSSFAAEWKNGDDGVVAPITGANKEEIITKLNESLQCSIVDQFGRVIDSNVYATILEEENSTESGFNKASKPIIGLNGELTEIINFSASSNKTTYLSVYVVDNKTTNMDKYVYASANTRLSLPKIKFVITSEGVDHIKQDVAMDVTTHDYALSPTTGSATVSKYVTTDSSIVLNDLLKVYTSTDDSSLLTDLQFRLTTTDSEILKMVTFFDADEQALSSTEATNKDVAKMKFLAPFGKDGATIKFVVFNNSGTFEIELNFVCLADAIIAYNFDKYKTTANEDYLLTCPTNANIASVFADNGYELNEYLTISSVSKNCGLSENNYSWSDGELAANGNSSGLTFNSGTLTIGTFYSYEIVTFKIYYNNVVSEFAPQANILLYVNPNIIIKEEVGTADGNPTINVANIGSGIALSGAYKFYKATGYIEKGNFDDRDLLTVPFTYDAMDSDFEQYIKVDTGNFVLKDSTNRTLNLTLGEEVLQRFAIKSGTEGVDAIKVRVVGGKTIVNLADPILHTEISVALGFSTGSGSDPNVATINAVFNTPVSTVTYNEKVYLLLKENGEYNIKTGDDGYGLDSTKITGDLTIGSGGILKAKAINGFFSPSGTTENTFVVTKTISTLTVNVKMYAIVSKIGEKFVSYNSNDNTFGDVDFKTLISPNAEELEKAGVYKEVFAGQSYTVVNNQTENKLGFYYDSTLLADTTPTLTIEKVTGMIGSVPVSIADLVSLGGAGSYTINIKHLAEGLYNDVYAVLRLTFSSANSTFSWLYRIKIKPSFNVGSVTYPFVDGVEYLDENSVSYVDAEDKYTVNLLELFTYENSKYESGQRFTAPSATGVTFTPEFKFVKLVVDGDEKDGGASTMGTYFEEYGFGTGQQMTLKLREVYKNTPISVTIEAIFKVGDNKTIGSELQYTFAFNQGKVYKVTLTRQVGGGAKTTLTSDAGKAGKVYNATLKAGEEETKFSASLQYENGIIGTIEADKISAYLKEKNEGDLSKSLMKYVVLKLGATVDVSKLTKDVYVYKNELTTGDTVEFMIGETTYQYTITDDDVAETGNLESVSVNYVLEKGATVTLSNDSTTSQLEEDVYVYKNELTTGDTVEFMIGETTYQYTITDDDVSGTGSLKSVTVNYVLKKGSTITLEDGSTTSELTESICLWTEESFEENATIEFEIDGIAYEYTITEDDVKQNENLTATYKYFYLTNAENNKKVLHIKPKAFVDQDYFFEIGFYADEKTAFTIDLTVTSYYTWELNTTESFEFMGGAKYKFLKPTSGEDKNYIFETLRKDNGGTISNVTISLVNATTEYSNAADGYGVTGLTLGDLVKIVQNASDWKQSTIEFAPMTNPATFIFEVEIYKPKVGGAADETECDYTFTFSINVGANFTATSASYTKQDQIFGGSSINVAIANIIDGDKGLNLFLQTTDLQTEFKFLKNNEEISSAGNISETAKLTDRTDGEIFTIANYDIVAFFVADESDYDFSITSDTVKYYKAILRIPFTYIYTSKPNVALTANYPKLDGVNMAECEYIGTTATNGVYSAQANDFFNSKALFENASRIVAENLYSTNNYWTIKVTEIQGLTLTFNDGEERTITSTSENKVVLSTDYTGNSNETTAQGLDFKFTLDAGLSEGSVKFEVAVNKVPIEYVVKVVAGNNVTLKINAPNYDDNTETIYAEDLAKQEQHIFASNRILTYTLKSTKTYYLKFTNGSNFKIVTIAGEADKGVVMDLGESLVGYTYAGTYTAYSVDASGTIIGVTESSKTEDADVYVEAPLLTARIVAVYADGTEIKLSNVSLKYTIGSGAETSLESFTLEGWKEGEQKALNITAKYTPTGGTSVNIGTTITYNVKLKIDFVVENNADRVNNGALPFYTDIEAQLDDTYSPNLLDLSEVFGIKTVRGTPQYFTQDLMKQMGVNITLEEYGFTTCQVDLDGTGDDSLAKTAGQVHNILKDNLRKNANGDYVYYYTGLTPRAGYSAGQINTIGTNETSVSNYIALQGIKNGRNNIDWKLWAQGANNDGNFVMMKLTYSVMIGSSPVTATHNILFRVLPNSNIKFRDEHDSQVTSTSQVINGRSVATNSYDPYVITESMFTANTFTLNLFNRGDESLSRVIANINNTDSNIIHKFKFVYRANISEAGKEFNSLNVLEFNNANFNEDQWATSAENMTVTSIASATSLAITFNGTLAWGEKCFYIDFEDTFGYAGRFYFNLTSTNNPQLSSIKIEGNSTREFKEGSTMQFGSQYVEITPTTTKVGDKDYITFYPFSYSNKTFVKTYTDPTMAGQPVSDEYNDYIVFEFEEVGDRKITDVILTATLKNSLTVEEGSATLSSGTMITKTISATSINNVQISGNTGGDWKLAGTTQKITWTNSVDNNLVGASIVLQLIIANPTVQATAEGTSTPLGKFSVLYTYQDTAPSDNADFVSTSLTQLVSEGPTTDPTYEDTNIGITFSGIKSNGFKSINVAIEESVLETYVSNVTEVTVTGVEFWYKGKFLGNGVVPEEGQSGGINLTTNTNMYFYDGTSFGLSQTGTIKTLRVPHIDGILYGTGDTLSDVDMYITLNDGRGSVCKLHETVTFKRALSSDNTFGNDKVLDNVSPTSSSTILNDTLEVSLEPGESITFVINDSAITGIDEDGYLKNGANKVAYYAVTADTQVNPNKTYYVYNTTSKQFGQVYTKVFTSGTKYYELTATANTNATPVAGTTYYTRTGNETDGYTYTSETLESAFVTGTTYYTLEIAETEDETPVAGTTYYTRTGNETDGYVYTVATLADVFTTGTTYYEQGFKQANLITLTNDKPYAVTEYVGISASISNLQKNLARGSGFYIYIQNHTKNGKATADTPTITYNGNVAEVEKSDDIIDDDGKLISYTYIISGEIGEYSGITLNIENVAELSTTDRTTKELLYFLLSGNDQTYQYQKVFTVYPQYTKAEADGEIIVENYVTVSNGTQKYYVVGITDWTQYAKTNLASNNPIKLTKGADSSPCEDMVGTSNAYKFRFDVSSESGAVYIDENGTITTSDDFDINTGYFKVSIYIKMSGNNGQFEDDNTDYLLGAFIVRLKPNTSDIGTGYDEGYYVFPNNTTFVVKNGYSFKGGNNMTLGGSSYTYTSTIACPIGEKLDFHKILDGKTLTKESGEGSLNFTTLANKTYHLAKITNKLTSAYEYINVANIDTYAFDTAGCYDLEVILTYRNKTDKSTNNNALIKLPIIVYDASVSAVREAKYQEVEQGNFVLLDNTSTETWWLLEDGRAKQQSMYKLKTETVPVSGKTYYVRTQNEDGDYIYSEAHLEVFTSGKTYYKLGQITELTPVSGKRYYTGSDGDGYTEARLEVFTDGTTYYELTATEATGTPVSGTTYYTYASGNYTEAEVSGTFAEGTTYYTLTVAETEDETPDASKTYYTYDSDNKQYVSATLDREFVDGVTYYVFEEKTETTPVVGTTYYTRTGSEGSGYTYTKETLARQFKIGGDELADDESLYRQISASETTPISGKTYYTRTGSDEAGWTYTKTTLSGAFVSGTTYYEKALKYYEVFYRQISASETTPISGKTYYTRTGSDGAGWTYAEATVGDAFVSGNTYYERCVTTDVFGATGRYEKQFLVMNADDTYKLVTYTFCVYDEDETVYKSVAMVVASRYKLANLIDSPDSNHQYTFYHQNSIKTEEYFENSGKGGNREETYYLLNVNKTTGEQEVKKYVVRYKIVGGTTDITESAYIPVSEYRETADITPVAGKTYYTRTGSDASGWTYTTATLSGAFVSGIVYFEKEKNLSQGDVFGAIKTLLDLNNFTTVYSFASGEVYKYSTSMKNESGSLISSGNYVIIQEWNATSGLLEIVRDIVTTTDEYKMTRKFVVTYGTSATEYTTKTLTISFFKHEKVTTGRGENLSNWTWNYVSETLESAFVTGTTYYTLTIAETEDETPDESKTYYTYASGTYTPTEVSEAFVEGTTYYELTATQVTGTTPVAGTTYYTRTGNAEDGYTYTEANLKVFTSGKTYYELTATQVTGAPVAGTTYYTYDSGKYTIAEVSGGFVDGTTYYTITATQVTGTTPVAGTTYYTGTGGFGERYTYSSGDSIINLTYTTSQDYTDFDLQSLSAVYKNVLNALLGAGTFGDSDYVTVFEFDNMVEPFGFENNIPAKTYYVKVGTRYFLFNITLEIATQTGETA